MSKITLTFKGTIREIKGQMTEVMQAMTDIRSDTPQTADGTATKTDAFSDVPEYNNFMRGNIALASTMVKRACMIGVARVTARKGFSVNLLWFNSATDRQIGALCKIWFARPTLRQTPRHFSELVRDMVIESSGSEGGQHGQEPQACQAHPKCSLANAHDPDRLQGERVPALRGHHDGPVLSQQPLVLSNG
jgi:hypothetical protein